MLRCQILFGIAYIENVAIALWITFSYMSAMGSDMTRVDLLTTEKRHGATHGGIFASRHRGRS